VDYDNLPEPLRAQGPITLADRVFDVIRRYLPEKDHVHIRLYGGWFLEEKLTKRAQDLLVALGTSFPYPLWIRDTSIPRLVPVTAQLAYSLEKLPKKFLHNTFRQRPPARRMSCEDPLSQGCGGGSCPLSPMVSFINSGHCSEAGCAITTKHLLKAHGGQKLVDTMLVADLAYLGTIDAVIAVVSSDDDIWPGVITALVDGAHVLHIRTGMANSGIQYVAGVPGKYSELSL